MAAYRAVRERVVRLLAGVDDGVASVTVVPACPGWTVTEVAGHLCGVCVDILEGNLEGAGTAPWADAQAARWAPIGLAAVLDQWNEVGPQVEAIGAAFPAGPAAQLVFDITTHEHDLRGTLGEVGARDTTCLVVPLAFLGERLDHYVRDEGLATLRLESPDGWTSTAGEGPAQIVVSATTFDLFRSFGGRRSLAQIRALDWTADPSPYLAVFDRGPLQPPDVALIE
jgi:uncharacterized protein (TIGR03083 family)